MTPENYAAAVKDMLEYLITRIDSSDMQSKATTKDGEKVYFLGKNFAFAECKEALLGIIKKHGIEIEVVG